MKPTSSTPIPALLSTHYDLFIIEEDPIMLEQSDNSIEYQWLPILNFIHSAI